MTISSFAGRCVRFAAGGVPYPVVRFASKPSVLMWHGGRCGSTVLGELLDQHSAIAWHSEIFCPFERNPRAAERFDRTMRSLSARSVSRIAGYEIKGLPSQHPSLMRRPLPEMLAAMKAYGLGAGVHLCRRNVLLQLLSGTIVREKLVDAWNIRPSDPGIRDGKIRFDVEHVGIGNRVAPLADTIDYVVRHCEDSRALMSRELRVLSLVYEDDIEKDPTRAYGKVIEFLGLPSEPVTVKTRKINTRSLPDLLENYDEVRAALAGTPHAWMAEAG